MFEGPHGSREVAAGQGDEAQAAAESCLPAWQNAKIEALRLQFSDFAARAQEASRPLVVNTVTRGPGERIVQMSRRIQLELWSTACGILYGNTRFFRTSADRPEWQKCRRCFPQPGAAREGTGARTTKGFRARAMTRPAF